MTLRQGQDAIYKKKDSPPDFSEVIEKRGGKTYPFLDFLL
jgi:hypothetical protein